VDKPLVTYPFLRYTNSDTEFNLFLPNNTFTGSELVKIKLSYNNNGVGSKGFLDKIELIAKRKLQGYGKTI
jgi:hypothetical protein